MAGAITGRKSKSPSNDKKKASNKAINELALKTAAKTKPDSHDIDELKRRFVFYFNECQRLDVPLSNLGVYGAIGFEAHEVADFISTSYNDDPVRGDFFRYVNRVCGAVREARGNTGSANVVSTIFQQKNFDGMKDIQEIKVNNPGTELRDLKAIEARYKDVIDIDLNAKPMLPERRGDGKIEDADIEKRG